MTEGFWLELIKGAIVQVVGRMGDPDMCVMEERMRGHWVEELGGVEDFLAIICLSVIFVKYRGAQGDVGVQSTRSSASYYNL